MVLLSVLGSTSAVCNHLIGKHFKKKMGKGKCYRKKKKPREGEERE